MDFWSAIVIIVVISVVGGIVSQHLKNTREGARKGLDQKGDFEREDKLKPYLERIDQLEDRVKVLERIATDKGRNLSDEIDRL